MVWMPSVALKVCAAAASALFVSRGGGEPPRDSVAVPTVTIPVPKDVPTWRLSPEPVLRITGGDATMPFWQFVAIRLRDDGMIVVVPEEQAGGVRSGGLLVTSRILLFDSTGRLRQRIGRRGKGPGEYQTISEVVVLPRDTMLVFDNWSVTVLTREGKYVRRFPTPGCWSTRAMGSPFVDGSVPLRCVVPRGLGYQMFGRLILSPPRFDTLSAPFDPTRARSEENVVVTPQVSYASGRNAWYHADGADYTIVEHAVTGQPTRTIRIARAPRATTKADTELWSREYAAMGFDPSIILKRKRFPDRVPAISDLLVDRSGKVWLREGALSFFRLLAPATWLVFDPSSTKVIAKVVTPAGMNVTEVGRNHVLGRCADEDGNFFVCMYKLLR